MAWTVLIGVAALASYWAYSGYSGFQKNLADARRSGLPYVVTPLYMFSTFWLLSHRLWLPLLAKLPKSWTEGWLEFMYPDFCWQRQFDPFEERGDILLVVSPQVLHIFVTNAEAIHKITSRLSDFRKPIESYRILDLYGTNVITTEGTEWRKHRKISAPSFSEKNNALVFEESLKQTQAMLRKWTASGNKTIEEVPEDTMRWALNIIGKVGFGRSMFWPGEHPSGTDGPPEGHLMTFEDSISTLLDKVMLVLLLPEWFLKRLPFKAPRLAHKSYVEWTKYMHEMFDKKVKEAREGKIANEGMDMMGSLVRASYGNVEKSRKPSPNRAEKGEIDRPVLTDSEIFGNTFVLFLAGHETTANSLHFSLMELAISPRPQRLVQKEIHALFGDTPPEEWEYESSINSLLGGIVGAVLNEQLRIMPPVVGIPKRVTKDQDQILSVEGKEFIFPAGAQMSLNTPGTQRNPKHWPSQPSKITNRKNDLNDFRPERWLVTEDTSGTPDEGAEFWGDEGRDTHAKLFRPERGAYFPFSEGSRSCLGRRLAQVEMMASLAVVFQKYSVELAVDEWATDDEVAKMTIDDKISVYKKAQDKARATIRSATSQITLKLHPGFIPVRIVERGDERFVDIVDI